MAASSPAPLPDTLDSLRSSVLEAAGALGLAVVAFPDEPRQPGLPALTVDSLRIACEMAEVEGSLRPVWYVDQLETARFEGERYIIDCQSMGRFREPSTAIWWVLHQIRLLRRRAERAAPPQRLPGDGITLYVFQGRASLRS
jgi:hypothetical protein